MFKSAENAKKQKKDRQILKMIARKTFVIIQKLSQILFKSAGIFSGLRLDEKSGFRGNENSF